MFNVNSINPRQSKPIPKDMNVPANAYIKPSHLKLSKLEDKDETALPSTNSPIIGKKKNNNSTSSNFILNNNSFKEEKVFNVANLNFRSISKKSDESINSKSPTDRMFRNNKSRDTRSNAFTPKNLSLTPKNLGIRSLNRSSFTQSGDIEMLYKKNEYSLAENLSEDKAKMNIVKDLEIELREKNEEIKILKRNFKEKINHLETENKKTIEHIDRQNKANTENLNKNYENFKVELNYQTSQMKSNSEETLNRLMADLKMSKHNNISIHLYNNKLSEVSTKWNENFLLLKTSYEKSMTEVLQLLDRNDYKELMERIKFYDKYKDKIKFQLPKDIEKNKFLLSSEEALNDIIKLKLIEVEATHLKEYSKTHIEFERSLNENCDRNKEKLEKIKEFAYKRFSEVERISIFTKDYFNDRDELRRTSMYEARFNKNNSQNRNSNRDNFDANTLSKDREFVRFNSNLLKTNADVEKLMSSSKNVFQGENFYDDFTEEKFEPDIKFIPMEFKPTEEYSMTLKNMEEGSEGDTKSKNTFMSVEHENFFIDDEINYLKPSKTLYKHHKHEFSDFPKDL